MEAEEILIEEVELLLDDVAPNEADTAALYVESPGSFLDKGSDERAFGIPGAGFASLVGPILVGFVVMIAKSFIENVVKKGTETAATSFLARLMRVFRLEPATGAPLKEKTVKAITSALIDAGWDAGRAGETAEKVWRSGISAGERLAAAG
ncbi:hypothetical protein BO221_17800 [Archangium sp. Cb G35]|uniref:hypothetical protein n=1 Tax=Archangium sp. Cb G35 TaxID=1920190 RepID=UPI0009366A25|nr:hypothetical protein [Archangium sp. Cb G35]OJT23821.1 hypothetical protein BO221_17800 [Archangium sp. Cb G35]